MKYEVATLPTRELFPGFRGRMIHSDSMTFAYLDIDAGADLPAHSHPHEQVLHMLAGEFELVVDGAAQTLRTGDVFAIPRNAVHSGRALTTCRVLDVFNPVREDFRSA